MVCRKICGRPFGYPLLSDSASYLDTGQTLVILGDGAVVVAAAVIVVQPLHNFLNGGGHGDGRTYSMGAVQSVVQILDVQVDLEAGLVVARDHHGTLGIHNRGTGEAAADGAVDHLRVNTGLLRQRPRLLQ